MLPLEALKQHAAIVGKTGSGKTYTARGAVEQLLEKGERVCIIDPTGVWWGLKSNSTGKRAGFPVVVFGGEHADIQISASHGDAIAEVVGTSTTPTIIDTSQMRTGERTKFFTDFANNLLRKNKGPLHLVIDEAHIFAPQGKVPDPASGAMLHAANNLVALGRSRGLRIIMITQRPAKLHKDSLTQIEALIALRLIAPQDRNAVQEWIKDQADVEEGKQIIASLASLQTGEGWIWAPELKLLKKVKFPKINTFDSSRAPDAAELKAIKMAPIDLQAIQGKLEHVEQEVAASDPAKLRQRIRELEMAARTPPKDNRLDTMAAATKLAVQSALKEGYDLGFPKGLKAGQESVLKNVREGVHQFTKLLNDLENNPAQIVPSHVQLKREDLLKFSEGAPKFRNFIPAKPPKVDLRPGVVNVNVGDGLDGPQRKIVRSLEFWLSRNITSASKAQVAMVAGYAVTSGSFKNPIGALRAAGIVEYPSPGFVTLVNGRAGDMSEDEAKLILMGVLDGPQQRIIQAVIKLGYGPVSRTDAAVESNYEPTSGSFKNPVGALCTLGLLLKSGPGMLTMAEWAREIL